MHVENLESTDITLLAQNILLSLRLNLPFNQLIAPKFLRKLQSMVL